MLIFSSAFSIRIHPTGGTTDRVATKDDVIPLGRPIELPSGEKLDQIRINAGQVSSFLQRDYTVIDNSDSS